LKPTSNSLHGVGFLVLCSLWRRMTSSAA
jgi:hypothetical protein